MKAKQIRAIQVKKDKLTTKVCAITEKVGKPLDAITRADLTPKEYDFIISYIKDVMKQPLKLYPNLK